MQSVLQLIKVVVQKLFGSLFLCFCHIRYMVEEASVIAPQESKVLGEKMLVFFILLKERQHDM